MITRCLYVLLLGLSVSHADPEKDDWSRNLEDGWQHCITSLLMPYDADTTTSLSKETNLPDFPLAGFKIVGSIENSSHLETAIKLSELLPFLHSTIYGNDSPLDEDCNNSKSCIADLVYQYGARYIQDFTGDNTVNCDDMAVLLYARQNATTPTTIACTTFFKLYRRNTAFLKHSQGIDVNDYQLKRNESYSVQPRMTVEVTPKKTDKDFFVCRNQQCGSLYEGGFITRCDGIVQCVDNSDEENCEACEGSSIQCLVHGVPTCLPSDNLCKFSPSSCFYKNGTQLHLEHCSNSNLQDTYNQCKVFLDKDYRRRFGEQVYNDTDGNEIRTPWRSYRDRLCRLNRVNIFERTGNEIKNLNGDILPSNYHEFQFINLNQSNCKDQVDQRLMSCQDSCPEPGDQGEREFWKCNNGRCIDEDTVCDGSQNCKDGEDETVQACQFIGKKYQDQDYYWNCPNPTFPCPISGKCIAEDLVCNGVSDCPDGEDEDSKLWVLSSDRRFSNQTNSWSLSHKTDCSNDGNFPIRRNVPIIVLLVISVIIVIFLALVMEPVEVEDSFMLRSKRAIMSLGMMKATVETILSTMTGTSNELNEDGSKKMVQKVDFDANSIRGIEKGPVDKHTITILDYLLIRNDFENQNNLKTKLDTKQDLADKILLSEENNLGKAMTKLKIMDTHYTSSLKDHIVEASLSLKLKKALIEKIMPTGEISRSIQIIVKLIKSIIPLYIIGAIVAEYYLDIALAAGMYSAFMDTDTTGFSFSPYFLGIFFVTCLTLIISYIAMIFIGSYKTYFSIKATSQKIFYGFGLILTPIFFPMCNYVFNLKRHWSSHNDFEKYLHDEVIAVQYQVILNQMTVVKTLLENMPQLCIAFLLALSEPLREKVEKFQYPIIVFLFIYIKPIITIVSKAWQISTFHKNKRDRKVGLVGSILVCLSVFFCTVSRVFAVIFCIIFSSCFPDIPFFLYWLSNAGIYQNEITPFVRETVYQANISYAPAIFVVVLLVVYPIVYYLMVKYLLLKQKNTQNDHSFKVQVLIAITNNFCPLKPRLNFPISQVDNHTNAKINIVIYSSFFFINLLFLIFPFICYGTSFFTTTLPVLDELMRYYRFKNSAGHLPLSFPRQLPTLFLHGHIIFPITSILCFLIGSLLYVVYQVRFHLWASVKPTDVAEFFRGQDKDLEEDKIGQEEEIEMNEK